MREIESISYKENFKDLDLLEWQEKKEHDDCLQTYLKNKYQLEERSI